MPLGGLIGLDDVLAFEDEGKYCRGKSIVTVSAFSRFAPKHAQSNAALLIIVSMLF